MIKIQCNTPKSPLAYVVVSSLNSYTGQTKVQIPSTPNVSPVLKYGKIVVPSVGLMSQFSILTTPKASDRVYQQNSNPYGPTLYSKLDILGPDCSHITFEYSF